MKIVVAGPNAVNLLEDLSGVTTPVPVHSFPLTAQLSRLYIEAGHQVRIVVQSRNVSSAGLTFGNDSLSVSIVPARPASKAIPDWFRADVAAIRQAIQEWQPDVIHAQWTYEYARGALATKLPCLVTAHDVPTRIFRSMTPRYYWWPKLLQGFLVARKATLMTAQSPYTLSCWQKEMGRKGPIELVPNGISRELLTLGNQPSSLKQPTLFVSACSGFDERKNSKSLLKAFQIVRSSTPDARLRLYGPGYGRSEVAETWAIDQKLGAGVEFVGKVGQLEMLTQIRDEASVYVHPALEESFGMSVAEAMSLSLPVIGGKEAGAVPWLLDEGKAGILCDVRSPTKIAESMLSAVSRTDLGRAARERVKSHFSLDLVSARYLELLTRLAQV